MARTIWRAFYRDEKSGGFFSEEYEVAAAPSKKELETVLRRLYPNLVSKGKSKGGLFGSSYLYRESREFKANPIRVKRVSV